MKLLREIRLRLVTVERRRVRDRFDLIDDRLVDLRVGVADADRQHAAETIEVLVPLIVPNVKAFAAHQSQRLLVVSGDRREEKLLVFADGVGLCGLWFW